MIKTIKENLVFSNKYFKVFNNIVQFNNKTNGEHIKLEGASKQNGISVLPVLSNGNILLIKNYRYAVDNFVYQVVKGGNGTIFENKEMALQCLKEELEEEINKTSDNIIHVSSYYESPSLLDLQCESFIALNCKDVVNKKHYQEDSECIDSIIEVNVNDIDDFLNNKNTCAITLALIYKYKTMILEEKLKKTLLDI